MGGHGSISRAILRYSYITGDRKKYAPACGKPELVQNDFRHLNYLYLISTEVNLLYSTLYSAIISLGIVKIRSAGVSKLLQ